MPIYFFDMLERDGKVTHDLIGVEMDNTDQALEAASQTILNVLQDNGMQHSDFKVQVIVRDEDGKELGRRVAQLRRSDRET